MATSQHGFAWFICSERNPVAGVRDNTQDVRKSCWLNFQCPAPRWVLALFSLTPWMTSEYYKQISSFQGLHSAAVAKKATDFLVLDSHHKQNRAKTKVKLYLPAGISEFIARNEIRIAGVTFKAQSVERPAPYPHRITDLKPHREHKDIHDTPWHWVLSLQTLLSTRSNCREIRPLEQEATERKVKAFFE